MKQISDFFYLLLLCVSIPNLLIASYIPTLKPNSVVLIEHNWDLKGKRFLLPDNVILNFTQGKILNGELVGANTKISGRQINIFDNISISGTWNVPEVRTSMFVNLDYDNSLRDVLALTDSTIFNFVTIEEGDYFFSLNDLERSGICVKSKTLLIIDGRLILKGNSLRSYDIVKISGHSISIMGHGSISGDLLSHTDKGGEWGMGIGIYKSTDVLIKNLKVSECWGDCIYIGAESGYVVVDGCKLSKGRRQGISVTSAQSVMIMNSVIEGVGGTSPGYAIDIEPNKNEFIGKVCIDDVLIKNCFGGIFGTGKAEGAKLQMIELNNCKVIGSISDYAFRFRYQQNLSMKDCLSESSNKKPILIQFIDNVYIDNVKVNGRLQSVKTYKCGKINTLPILF